MAFVVKDWEDEPNPLGVLEGTVAATSPTPIDAAGLRDAEARLSDYSEAQANVVSERLDAIEITGTVAFDPAANQTITGDWEFDEPLAPVSVAGTEGLLHTLRDIAGAGDRAAAHYWYATDGLDTDGLAWVTAIDVGAPVPYRDLVLAAKTGYPGAGNVRDFIYALHNGAAWPPTLGIGPGMGPAFGGLDKFNVNIKAMAADQPSVGTLRLIRDDAQTGDVLAITTTGALPGSRQVWIDKDYATTIQSSATTPFKVQTNAPTTLLKVLTAGLGSVVIPALMSLGAGALDTPGANLDIKEASTTDAVMKLRTASNAHLEIRSLGGSAISRIQTMNASTLELGTNGVSHLKMGTAGQMGFFGTAAIAKPTGVAVTAGGIHAALVSLGLIAA